MGCFISEVVSIDDKAGGRRIKARVMPHDRTLKVSEIPYAFPALPKMMHIVPKVGEAVIIVCGDKGEGQRYYIGPLIHQDQFMEMDYFGLGATNLLDGGADRNPSYSIENDGKALGAVANDEDVAIYGRKDTEMILKDEELQIRSGARRTKNSTVTFNKEDPSFIKLKYHEEPLTQKKLTIEKTHRKTKSTAVVSADKIMLVSPSGDGGVNLTNNGDLISDDEMQKMIERIHMLPYGDTLVDFLYLLVKMFKEHTHKYDNMPPSPLEPAHQIFDTKYGTSAEAFKDKLLSKDVGIN